MNRNRAGLLAIGVLFVAIAIVLVGGIFDREVSAPRQVSATTTEPAAPANEKAAEPDKAAPAAPDATGGAKDAKAAPASAAPEPRKADAAASNPSTAEAKPDQTPDANQTASRKPAAPPPPASDTAADRTAKPLIPAFDILRVEPDGSTVIAGHAAPGSKVQIMNGDKTVIVTDADERGDFVAVLDQPLAPGDYELKLKAQARDGKAVESEEVATVSVPADSKGDLLAMVTKPGQASRIITAPKPTASDAATKDTETAPSAPVEAMAETGEPTATTEAGRGNRPAATSDAGSSQVRVDAVEIEGDSVYVAGAAPAGSTVRVYADDKLVGEAEATEEGRFVVDARMPLAVGDHSVRADLIDPVTGQVLVRASVPFTRPAGDQFSAVAADAKTAPTASASDDTTPSPDIAKLQSDAEAALSDLRTKTESATPSADEIEQARDKAARSLRALANGPRADPDAPTGKADEGVRRKAGSALAMLDALPRLAKGSLPDVATMKAMRSKLPDVEKSLRGEPGDKTRQPATEAAVGANEPKTLVQPALTSSDEFVIIRRGDTLWQIARRAYGRGVRYTTIYLANSEQISDPDLILPGQIFDVPQTPLMNSEELHRERMREEKHSSR